MRIQGVKVEKSRAAGGLFDGLDIWFGRDDPEQLRQPLSPLCLIGPNGSGKSQFLQLLAEIFQAAWHEHDPQQERISVNEDILFEVTYLFTLPDAPQPEQIKLCRTSKGHKVGKIELFRNGEGPILPGADEFGLRLPSLIVGYSSGDNETLSLPFLASRSGYAGDVAYAALHQGVENSLPDNRLMLIDYGTNLEVLFANLMLGAPATRLEILRHARLSDLASCRCIVRLAHSAAPKAPPARAKASRRKGIQLTEELERTIESLKRAATCWNVDEKTETYVFDFFVTEATRKALGHFWDSALSLYRSLHKLALLNDLAIPRAARKRLERAVKEHHFASRLPEPQQEDMVFSFEEVRFRPDRQKTEAVDYVSLSDGEHQQALILGAYAMISEPNALFLLDEPESHFNPRWRVQFVQRLMNLTGSRSPQELIMTTHAPFVPSDMPRQQVLIFSREGDSIEVSEPQIETFGATFDRILETCFDIRPPNSKIAEAQIEKLLKSDDLEEVEHGFNDLGPSSGKALLADHLRKLRAQ